PAASEGAMTRRGPWLIVAVTAGAAVLVGATYAVGTIGSAGAVQATGSAYATRVDGPKRIPQTRGVTVARLAVPAGTYVISAKALLRNNAGDTSFTDVSCTLAAGRARDTARTWLNPETGKRFRP